VGDHSNFSLAEAGLPNPSGSTENAPPERGQGLADDAPYGLAPMFATGALRYGMLVARHGEIK